MAGLVGQGWAGCLTQCDFCASQNILDNLGHFVGVIALGNNLFDLGLKRTDVEIVSDVFADFVKIIGEYQKPFLSFLIARQFRRIPLRRAGLSMKPPATASRISSSNKAFSLCKR